MGGSKIRARLVDIGRGDVFEPTKFKPIPEDLKKLEVYCQRYKLADLKPKGRDEGFSGKKLHFLSIGNYFRKCRFFLFHFFLAELINFLGIAKKNFYSRGEGDSIIALSGP